MQNKLFKINDAQLWKLALANPVPLFKTLPRQPLLAIFDEKVSSCLKKRKKHTIRLKICLIFTRLGSNQKIIFTLAFQTRLVVDGKGLMPITLEA